MWPEPWAIVGLGMVSLEGVQPLWDRETEHGLVWGCDFRARDVVLQATRGRCGRRCDLEPGGSQGNHRAGPGLG